jgi:hypothetical protein
MSWRNGLRKGRSHLLFALVLAAGGLLVVNIEDDTLERETGGTPRSGSSPAISPVAPSTPTSPAPIPPVSKLAARPAPQVSDTKRAYVQIGAYQSEARAAREGRQVLRELGDPADIGVRIEPFRSLYRLQLGPLAVPDAAPLCQRLVSQERDCRLVWKDQKTSSKTGS